MSDDEGRLSWERRAEWPLAIGAVLFLAAYAVPILAPAGPDWLTGTCRVVTWLCWAAFAGDYLARLYLSGARRRFVRRHLVDLLIIALPVLRPLRLLRLVLLLKVLNRRTSNSLRGRVALYVGASAAIIIFTAALAVLDEERHNPQATIHTFGEALWWAVTTVTTVGYGDYSPTTGTGRLVAVGLMLCGIALIGVVTASVASWLLERVREVELESQAATRADVQALAAEVAALRTQLATLPRD